MMTPAEKLSKKLKDVGPRKEPNIRARKVKWSNSLRAMRESLGLMSVDVAKWIGVSTATINTAETGYDPVLSTAIKLAEFYGKRVEDIWTALPETDTP